MTAAEPLYTTIEGLLNWAYGKLCESPRFGVMSSYEPGIRSTDPTEPVGCERHGEGCGPRAIVNTLKPIDRLTIEAEYLLPKDIYHDRKEYATRQVSGYYFQQARPDIPHQFAVDRFRHWINSRDARMRDYAHHDLEWWGKHLKKTRSYLRHRDAEAKASIRNWWEQRRSIAHANADAAMRQNGWLHEA